MEGNTGQYYNCGIGAIYDLKYELNLNGLTTEIYDFEYQYKQSKQVLIARIKFTTEEII